MMKNALLGLAATVALAAAAVFISSAKALPVYAGGTYDPGTGTGAMTVSSSSGTTLMAGDGMGANWGTKYVAGVNMGYRAYRWGESSPAVELGNLGTDSTGKAQTHAYALDAAGTAIGSSETYTGPVDLGSRAVRWDAGSNTPTQLGNLGTNTGGYTTASANAINSHGTIVGSATKYWGNSSGGSRPVRWANGSTTATELDTLNTGLGSDDSAAAVAINDAGTVVGYGLKYQSVFSLGQRILRWAPGSTAVVELGNLGTDASGNTWCDVYAMNASGTAVGEALKAGIIDNYRAVRWDGSGTAATELGNLGTDASGKTKCMALDINDAGTAVGYVTKYVAGASVGLRAVRWEASGTAATELGGLGITTTATMAWAINRGGVVVGQWTGYEQVNGPQTGRAVAWEPDGTVINLNHYIAGTNWSNLTGAEAISDTGWIVGKGYYDPDGAGPVQAYVAPFLMDASSILPVPEPASALVVVAGVAGMLARRRRAGC